MKLFFIVFSIVFTVNAGFAQQNPAAIGFDLGNSDTKAIEIADKVMIAMGGRKNWDKTRYISWVFFGARKHIWDKWTGDIRIEGLKDKSVTTMNINKNTGKVFRNGALITNADSTTKYLKSAKGAWINDSYWLVMPFKLKDSGVTLKYLGDSTNQNSEPSYLLGLSFKEVGNTPQNGYKVWVTKSDNLVKQWSYFSIAKNDKPGFTLPWINYKMEGKILLSGDRGERKLTEIKVLKKIDKRLLHDPEFKGYF